MASILPILNGGFTFQIQKFDVLFQNDENPISC